MITTAGISRIMFLIVFRRDEGSRLRRSVAIQTPSFGQPIRSKKQQRVKYHNLYAASNRTVSPSFRPLDHGIRQKSVAQLSIILIVTLLPGFHGDSGANTAETEGQHKPQSCDLREWML
jgi:hypothetical protein